VSTTTETTLTGQQTVTASITDIVLGPAEFSPRITGVTAILSTLGQRTELAMVQVLQPATVQALRRATAAIPTALRSTLLRRATAATLTALRSTLLRRATAAIPTALRSTLLRRVTVQTTATDRVMVQTTATDPATVRTIATDPATVQIIATDLVMDRVTDLITA